MSTLIPTMAPPSPKHSTSRTTLPSPSPTTLQTQEVSRLLDLPPEIRAHIWSSAFNPTFNTITAPPGTVDIRARHVPTVSHLSRQIRHEALALYYNQPFGVDHPAIFQEWLSVFEAAIPASVGRVGVWIVQSNQSHGAQWRMTESWARHALWALEYAAWMISRQERIDIRVLFVGGEQDQGFTLKDLEAMDNEDRSSDVSTSHFASAERCPVPHSRPMDEKMDAEGLEWGGLPEARLSAQCRKESERQGDQGRWPLYLVKQKRGTQQQQADGSEEGGVQAAGL